MCFLQHPYDDFKEEMLRFHEKISSQLDQLNCQLERHNNLLTSLVHVQEQRLAIEKFTNTIDL